MNDRISLLKKHRSPNQKRKRWICTSDEWKCRAAQAARELKSRVFLNYSRRIVCSWFVVFWSVHFVLYQENTEHSTSSLRTGFPIFFFGRWHSLARRSAPRGRCFAPVSPGSLFAGYSTRCKNDLIGLGKGKKVRSWTAPLWTLTLVTASVNLKSQTLAPKMVKYYNEYESITALQSLLKHLQADYSIILMD